MKQQSTIQDFFSSSDNDQKKARKLDSEESSEDQRPTKIIKIDSQETSQYEDQSVQDTNLQEGCENSSKDNEGHSDEAPVYSDDVKECIKETFLLEMPEDFYQFWDFCKQCNKLNPRYGLKKTLNLCLTGPFDILSGRHKKVTKNKFGRYPNFLLHQRFYYDPPEFQTILVSDGDDKFHIGYFRDDPTEMPVFMASNSPGSTSSSKEKLVQCGDNVFAAVHIYATHLLKTHKGEKKKLIEQLVNSLEKEAKKLNLSLLPVTKTMKERQKKVNCPTFHGAGMVVPVDDNEVGYRPVPETQKDLKAMLKQMVDGETEAKREQASEALQEIITFIQFANDECDYGEGLELGLCLFSYGHKELHSQISFLLPLAYQLLNRSQFQEIIEAHLKCRRGVTESVDELQV
ncbi:histone PARylation factor 1 [Elysia marginata]|uniref:Histone PARylation factor 1 n=1 Tax=Elysia marginata TaxID=1093978 RepID=A0AAV4EAB3_9GAST|nr:histone PARylation factor 1 [Elysia marginata]